MSDVRTSGTPIPIGYRRTAWGFAGMIVRWVTLVVATLLFLVPFYLILRNALSTQEQVSAADWTLFPTELQWSNLTLLLNDPEVPFVRSIWNSAVVAVLGTGGQLFLAAMAGYGLARIPYKHASKVFYLTVALLIIPAGVSFVPLFIVVSTLGWVGSLRGLIIPILFSAFAAFLFRQYFLNFPRELEEAARIDGLGYWRTFWRIVMPNSIPFVAALAAITFINNWNSFLWPLVINGTESSSWTVQIALATFITAQTINIPELFMAAGVAMLPLACVFAFLQRYLIQGITETGIKG